jgi:hypothetical protein
VCLSLKEASNEGREIQLSVRVLESLKWLSDRKNKNENKYIYDLIINSISRQAASQFRQHLFRILFQIINNKRISKEFYAGELSPRQQIWLETADDAFILDAIETSSSQEDYHRLVILIDLKQNK